MTQAQGAARSYRFTTKAVGADGSTGLNSTTEVVCPNKSHTTLAASASLPGRESIRIGNDQYVKNATGWTKSTTQAPFLLCGSREQVQQQASQALQQQQLGFDVSQLDAQTRAAAKFQLQGVETLDGTACQKWQITIPPNTVSALSDGLSETVWIGSADHLPRQASIGGSDNSSFLVTYSGWNSPITIDPPIP